LLRDAILNSQMLPSLPIFRSSGSITPSASHQVNHQNSDLSSQRIVDVVPLVGAGTTTDVQTQLPPAITSMFVPNVQMEVTLPANAHSQARNKLSPLGSHWDKWPRYARDYIWGRDEPQYISTAITSETAAPVPCPPYNEICNETAWTTINSSPHLFRITTPINVNRFRTLLASHPNQVLVDSVCRGLKEGFWPWANTDGVAVPNIVDNASLQKVRNPEHLKFIRKQRERRNSATPFFRCFPIVIAWNDYYTSMGSPKTPFRQTSPCR
jgi:hypothetical protein